MMKLVPRLCTGSASNLLSSFSFIFSLYIAFFFSTALCVLWVDLRVLSSKPLRLLLSAALRRSLRARVFGNF